ncbi:GPW/gp25 family protein [Dactylosporangium sp. McL0621]|uniref:GPW/gp25 family protein n=1 Tax=Dactylosporangium sp. McL0621 TaxID=3415678 RepID=UPI003CE80B98
MNAEFYGRGMTYPLQVGIAGIGESAGEEKVEQSIRVILGTQFGERVMRPRFGCNLRSLVFAPNDVATANLARYYVQEGLAGSEPRVDVVGVDVDNDPRRGALIITVTYRLRATQDVRNLVYPFYLERGR